MHTQTPHQDSNLSKWACESLTAAVGDSPQNQIGMTQRHITSTLRVDLGTNVPAPSNTPIIWADTLTPTIILQQTTITTTDTPPVQRQLPVGDKNCMKALVKSILKQHNYTRLDKITPRGNPLSAPKIEHKKITRSISPDQVQPKI
jgi:hypothetical protein